MSIGFAMAACLGWGIADFIGGLKSRDLPTLTVLIISNGVGVFLLAAILTCDLQVMGSGRPFLNDPHLIWAVPAGITGIAAMYLLYRSLAMGTMSVLAPISATGVILPVIWGILSGDTLSGLKLTGMAAAFLGTMLAAMEKNKDNGKIKWTHGIQHALGAAICIGFYFILMDKACQTDPLWASMIMRTTTFIFLIPVILISRSPGFGRPIAKDRLQNYLIFCFQNTQSFKGFWKQVLPFRVFRSSYFVTIPKSPLAIIIFMGVMDTLAAFAFALATRSGMLSIVAVISSLYPAVTVLLSAVIIREKLRAVQSSGVLLAILGVVLISGF